MADPLTDSQTLELSDEQVAASSEPVAPVQIEIPEETARQQSLPPDEYLKLLPRRKIIEEYRNRVKAGEQVDREPYLKAYWTRAAQSDFSPVTFFAERDYTQPEGKISEIPGKAWDTVSNLFEGGLTQLNELSKAATGYDVAAGQAVGDETRRKAFGSSITGPQIAFLQSADLIRKFSNNLKNVAIFPGKKVYENIASDRAEIEKQFETDLNILDSIDRVKEGYFLGDAGSRMPVPLTPEERQREQAGIPIENQITEQEYQSRLGLDPETAEKIASSPLADPSALIPGFVADDIVRAGRVAETAAKGLQLAPAAEKQTASSLLRDSVVKPLQLAADTIGKVNRAIDESPLVRAGLAGGTSLAVGGDTPMAVLTGLLGAGVNPHLSERILGGLESGLRKKATQLGEKLPPGAMSQFAGKAFAAMTDEGKALMLSQAGNMPFLLGAQDEEEFQNMLTTGLAAHYGVKGAHRAANGLNFPRNFWKSAPHLVSERMPVKDYGTSAGLDALHRESVAKVDNTGNNFVQSMRNFFGKDAELYILTPERTVEAIKTLQAEGAKLPESITADPEAVAKQNGVTFAKLEMPNGQTRNLAFVTLREGAPGYGAGHEAGHLVEAVTSAEELRPVYQLIEDYYGEEGLAKAKESYEAAAKAAGQPSAPLTKAQVISELFAENASAYLNAIPVDQFGPVKNRGLTQMARGTYTLVERALNKIGAKVPKFDGSGGGPETGLGFDPSAPVAQLVENLIEARRIENLNRSSPDSPEGETVSPGSEGPIRDVREIPPEPAFKKGDLIEEIKKDGKVIATDGKIVGVVEPQLGGEIAYEIEYTDPADGKRKSGVVPEELMQSVLPPEGAKPAVKKPTAPTHPVTAETPPYTAEERAAAAPEPTPAPKVEIPEETAVAASEPVPKPAPEPAPKPNVRVTPEQQETFAKKATPEVQKANTETLREAVKRPRAEIPVMETDYFSAKSDFTGPDAVTRKEQRRLADAADALAKKTGKPNPLRAVYQKLFVPYSLLEGKTPRVFGFSLDKLIQNVDILRAWAAEKGEKTIANRLGSPEFLQTMQNYLENQRNGYGGDGTRIKLPADVKPGSITLENPKYVPHKLSEADKQLVNLLMGVEVPQRSSPGSRFASRMGELNGISKIYDLNGVEITNPLYLELQKKGFNTRLLNSTVENLPIANFTTPLKPRLDLKSPAGDIGITRAGFMPAVSENRKETKRDRLGVDFHAALSEAAEKHPFGAAVEVKSPEFYANPENQLFLSPDKSAGAAVTPEGDLVSVFKKPGSKADIDTILKKASESAVKLDAFDAGDGRLQRLYAKYDFRPVARVEFDPSQAPANWPAHFGKPDVVMMVKDPKNLLGLPDAAEYGKIKESVPLVSYEEAQKLQAEAVEKLSAPAEFHGIQSGFDIVPDIELYNLTQDIPGHPKDSTVSRQTLEKAGFRVPPRPAAFMPAVRVEPSTLSKERIEELKNDPSVVWHGSASGDLRGGPSGLHVGTFLSAKQALEARIGRPAEGEWDGTREYGKTLLAGDDKMGVFDRTGFNARLPKEDFYPKDAPRISSTREGGPVVGDMSMRPTIAPFRISGKMSNSRWSAHDDFKANGMMRGLLKRNKARSGFYYTNVAEDSGSVSAVLPDGGHLDQVMFMPQTATEPLEHSVGGTLDLVHYGSAGMKNVDPKRFGSSRLTPQSELAGEPRGYFYVEGKVNKDDPAAARKDVFHARVDGGQIYDGDTDALGYGDIINRSKADQMLKDAGYIGIQRTGGSGKKKYVQVELFEKTPVSSRRPAAFMPETPGQLKEKELSEKGYEFVTRQDPDTPRYWKVEALLPDGKFAGTLGVDIDPRTNFAEITGIYVAKNHRRQGIADTLYRRLGRLLQGKGVRKLGGELKAQATFDLRQKIFGKPEYLADFAEEISPEEARSRLPDVMGEEEGAGVYMRSRVSPRAAFMPKVDDLGFYSNLEKSLEDWQAKGTPDQLLAHLLKTAGAKEELSWLGLDEFLKDKKNVTRDEVAQFIRENAVQLKEVQKGGGLKLLLNDQETETQGRDIFNVVGDDGQTRFTGTRREAQNYIQEEVELAPGGRGLGGAAKFSNYVLPGGENYREVLLTLPTGEKKFTKADLKELPSERPNVWTIKSPDNTYNILKRDHPTLEAAKDHIVRTKQSGPNDFKSGHFDEPNILAHARVNERVDASGNPILFIEEIQSDWHQEGRKKGYGPQDLFAIYSTGVNPIYGSDLPRRLEGTRPTKEAAEKWAEELQKSTGRKTSVESVDKIPGVPDAPFKTSWPKLVLKRLLRLAVEQGKDRIAWTTGEQQAERYDLSKQIDSIAYKRDGDLYTFDAIKDSSVPVHRKNISLNEVESLLGKDIAQKMESGEGKRAVDYGPKNWRELEGVDLKVGGEGMKAFYDRILPNFANEIGKKYGARAEKTSIELAPSASVYELQKNNPEVHVLPITPALREAVLAGQALFMPALAGKEILGTVQGDDVKIHILPKNSDKDHSDLGWRGDKFRYNTATQKITWTDLREEVTPNIRAEAEEYLKVKGYPVRGHEDWSGKPYGSSLRHLSVHSGPRSGD